MGKKKGEIFLLSFLVSSLTFLFLFLLLVCFVLYCPDFTFPLSCIRSDTAAAQEWQHK